MENNRYKAVIDGEEYTIIGKETKAHMDLVTKLVNSQLKEIKRLAPKTTTEQASILSAVNAMSDQLKKQEELITLRKENRRLELLASETEQLQAKLLKLENAAQKEQTKLKDVEEYLNAQTMSNDAAKQRIQEANNPPVRKQRRVIVDRTPKNIPPLAKKEEVYEQQELGFTE